MQNKRLYLILLILGGILGILAVIFFILRPFDRAQQPPGFGDRPPERPFNPQQDAVPQPIQPSDNPPSATDPAEAERQAQEAAKRFAMDYGARQGTYSSANGFASIETVYNLSSQGVQDFLENRQNELQNRYPVFGPTWGRTSRTLSASIARGIPVLSANEIVVAVQAQIIVNDTNGSEAISYETIRLTMIPRNGGWVVTNIQTEALEL